jgi:hypothetical protein
MERGATAIKTIFTSGVGKFRSNRIWFKIRQKFFAAEENGDKKMATEKNVQKFLFITTKIMFQTFLLLPNSLR